MQLPEFHTGRLAEADGAQKPYVLIEGGPTAMVVVPGVADGLRTCVDVAVYLAWFYRERVQNFRLLILSRREPIPPDFGVEKHADDMIRSALQLGFGPAVWECLSAGGPIGQWVAVKRPDLVRGLILSSSYAHVSGRLKKTLGQWLAIAEHEGGRDPFWEMLEPKYRPPAHVLASLDPALLQGVRSPGSSTRFQNLLRELIDLDQREILPRVSCPTLVVGGQDDRYVPAELQQEMARCIPNSELELFPGYGHFNDMENPAYQPFVARYAQKVAAAST
jgi:pimeloyl-ACP methyl ester carboxylesterase